MSGESFGQDQKEFRLRRAKLKDAAALQHFLTVLLAGDREAPLDAGTAPTVAEERLFIHDFLESPRSYLVLALVKNDIVGALASRGPDHPGDFALGKFGLSVAKDWRRRGIGHALMESLTNWVETSQRVDRVELDVHAANVDAIRLYEQFEFRRVENPTAKRDEDKDVVIMERTWARES